ncbi:GntR family transcriptional regulator [Novosphingobium sp. Rr 2-17]|uniref:GntR family transcriptional regulator n=1 Tax=Novosphingobium sp. Rr 2-17 TaxID=555793 RepID=UPI000269AB3B|nr:GntR family transcriptional regulator [Novosphingobium sp. Rr 2-17]EIZ79591.1 GntR family transcriptional regulator [Novosphingobium sp. Rr 2-17]
MTGQPKRAVGSIVQGGVEADFLDADLITGRRASRMKRSHRAADRLQRDLLDGLRGKHRSLGSIAEIRERYGLGRWACREAIGILELRGVGELRTGRGGGLIAASPGLDDLAKLTLLHLYVKRSSTRELVEARRIVYLAALREVFRRNGNRFEGQAAVEVAFDPNLQMAGADHSAFALWLADRTGNRAFRFAIDYIEALCDNYLDLAEVHPSSVVGKGEAEMALLLRAMSAGRAAAARKALVHYLDAMQLVPDDRPVPVPSLLYKWHSAGTARSARRLAMALIEEIAASCTDGAIDLGSEFDIGVRHDANAAIVRQAIRLLEDLAIATPRRGRGGGIDVRRPDVTSIVGLIPHVLVQERLDISDCFEAAGMLDVEIAMAGAAARANWGPGGEEGNQPGVSREPTRAQQLISIEQSIADLSGNSVLSACERGFLMYACAIEPVDKEDVVPGPVVERVLSAIGSVAECVAAGDVDGAEAATLHKHKLLALRFMP